MLQRLVLLVIFVIALTSCENLDNEASGDEIKSSSQVKSSRLNEENNQPSCGLRNPEGVGFGIVDEDNEEAAYGEFPWMAAILTVVDDGGILNVYQCGASILEPNVVLTVAHCVMNVSVSELLVRAGEWDALSRNELFPHVDRSVKKVVIHKDFKEQSDVPNENDLALLFLEESIEFGEHINTACLPEQDQPYDDAKTCFVSGWGKNSNKKADRYHAILNRIELASITTDKCEERLKEANFDENFKLRDNLICASGKEGKGACKGNGGSPLVCPINGSPDRYYQAGIVTWENTGNCGAKDVPGVYVNVASYRKWIDEEILANK